MKTTSLDEERAAQSCWRLLPKHRGLRLFDELVENEFRPPELQRLAENMRLAELVRFAATSVPYWREEFERLRLNPADIDGVARLRHLPVMNKRLVHDKFESLQATSLPSGHELWGTTQSSGTTGRPTRIVHTAGSVRWFGILSQRQHRWFRFDPMSRFAAIRLATHLPPGPDGKPISDGETLRLPRWRHAGEFFATGPYLGLAVTNPIERQIGWLLEQQPNYLMSYSESLEHLALAWPPNGSRLRGLRSLHAVSEQVTPDMERRITRCFGAPVELAYGLNEIGIVAARCAAGRYHVHTEHCLVEIVDDAGQPVAPGSRGRIAVTALNNPAMPLLRYDTDDMATAVGDDCPCGRTLPAFGEIAGRYSRIAYLPEGTLGRVAALRSALETMPGEAIRDLRQFQLHQFRDGSFELRLIVAAPPPAAFETAIRAAWTAVANANAPLRLAFVESIPRTPGGKFLDFTSDFTPPPN